MRIACSVLVTFCAVGSAAAERAITPAEMTSWQIVSGPAASESECYAATEFQTLFKGLTGTELPIVTKAEDGRGAVFVGPGAVAQSRERAREEDLGEEGLRIRVGKHSVHIDGGRPRGTLYGVYEFFEELCGVRFLTHDHTYYPGAAAAMRIPLGVHRYNPAFAFRWSYYGETSKFPVFAARLRANTVSDDPKLGGRTGLQHVHHSVAYLLPPATYGKDHPEYYALVDGQRKLEMDGGGPQLCVSNPEVIELITQAVIKKIEKDPSVKCVSVAQMDNGGFCACENCAAIDAREGSHAGAHLALVNAVAERVEKSHPGVLISCYAYQYTRKPPKTIRARHNVLIQLCSIECCDFHAINDRSCALNRSFCDDMAGWKKKADTIFVWHYNTNFKGYLLPFPNLRSIGKSVKYFENNHGRGVFMQAAGNAESAEISDLRNYVMSRCLWKPGRDSWKEAEEFCRLHYGEAAQPIIGYLTYYHDLVGAAGVHPTCFPTESALCLNPESARRILAYFQQALSLAKSEEVRARVEKASLCAYRAALSAASMRLVYHNGVCRPDLAGLEPDIFDRFVALCQRFGVTREDENTQVATYIDSLRELQAGLKAVRIENDMWRLTLLPESNARIVEMTYKPTGRNVVQPARALNRFRYEEWVRQGQGPGPQGIVAYDAKAQPDRVLLTLTTKDGTRIERNIALAGDTIRFDTTMTASGPRVFDVHVHPEYDAATLSSDPRVVGVYVKSPEWLQANQGWKEAVPTEAQTAVIKSAASGGAFAYYNRKAGFGVEQRFDSQDYSSMDLFWSPSRMQVNLELHSKVRSLEKGQTARHAYEVRYLKAPPAGH
ncbi:MAG: DUF4838 domain-containing protein [Candidatus Hydrogenedentes bacterium]|nr:DUF4838 domain-containing protein [Candidatus Hydrogenedentota bacterium]